MHSFCTSFTVPSDYSSDLTKASAWHDMKTLLAAVKAGLVVLEKDTSDTDLLHSISLGVEKALDLAKNAQEEYASSFTSSSSSTNLSDCLESVVKIFTPLSERYKVTVNYSGGPDVLIETPKGVVEQIFTNLLSNAIKFSTSKLVTVEPIYTGATGFRVSSDFSDINQVLKLFTISRKDGNENSFNIGVPSMQNLLNVYGGDLVLSDSKPIYLSVFLP